MANHHVSFVFLFLAHQNRRFRVSYYYQRGGGDPASVDRRHVASQLVDSSETTCKIYFKFNRKHPCESFF